MAILRMVGGLSPDLEVELFRETSGETVRWAGRSSAILEKAHGWMLIGAGAFLMAFNFAAPLSVVGVILDLVEKGRAPETGYLLKIGVWTVFFSAAAAIVILGWRFISSAHRVVWAVTNARLIRLVAGGACEARSWTKADIKKVERIHWGDRSKRGIGIRVRGRRGDDPVLMIFGPVDLEAAERALTEMDA